MHRLARFAGPGSNLVHAAGGVQGALVRQLATLSILPNSSWPFHLLPEAHQHACQILPQSPADLWQHTTGLAASAAITNGSHRSWGYAPALPSQLQAAADLAQIQHVFGTGEADLGEDMLNHGMVCATKRTYQPSVIIRKRRHGFLSRIRSRGGRNVIRRRKGKGRYNISA